MKFEGSSARRPSGENPEGAAPIENSKGSAFDAVEQIRFSQKNETNEAVDVELRRFFQNELTHYQEAATAADSEHRNDHPYGYPWAYMQPDTDGEEAAEGTAEGAEMLEEPSRVNKEHTWEGSYQRRHQETAERTLEVLEAGDYNAVLRYLEGKFAQEDPDDSRAAEAYEQMRALERKVYQYLHPELRPEAPSLEEMENFFRTEQEQEIQHNRREADSGLSSDLVRPARKAYLAGDLAPTLRLIEASLGELAYEASHPPKTFSGEATQDPSADGSTNSAGEATSTLHVEALRQLWVRLATEGGGAPQ